MRSVWPILIAALTLFGCGEDAAPPKPLGSFVLDAEAMTAALQKQGMSEASARRNAAAGRVRLVFDPSGAFTLVVRDGAGRVERSSGRWTRDGSRLTLLTTQRAGKVVKPPHPVGARLTGDRLEVDSGREGTLPFLLRSE